MTRPDEAWLPPPLHAGQGRLHRGLRRQAIFLPLETGARDLYKIFFKGVPTESGLAVAFLKSIGQKVAWLEFCPATVSKLSARQQNVCEAQGAR